LLITENTSIKTSVYNTSFAIEDGTRLHASGEPWRNVEGTLSLWSSVMCQLISWVSLIARLCVLHA